MLGITICMAVSVSSDHLVIHPSAVLVGHQHPTSYSWAYSYANHHREVSIVKPVYHENPTLRLILRAQKLHRPAVALPGTPASSTAPELAPGYVRLAMKIDTPPGYKLFERIY